jgi:hypothetical protein
MGAPSPVTVDPAQHSEMQIDAKSSESKFGALQKVNASDFSVSLHLSRARVLVNWPFLYEIVSRFAPFMYI